MPPKRGERGQPGPKPGRGAARENIIDYPRPFFQRSLNKAEIMEDLALIQSSMRREHRAPARYGERGAADQTGRGGTVRQVQQQQQQQHPHQGMQVPAVGMAHAAYGAPQAFHPAMRGAPAPGVVYHTVQPVQVLPQHARYVVGS